MARARVNSDAQTSNVRYEGTLGVPVIDQTAINEAVDSYNEVRQDEFERLEKNLVEVADLQDEILGEQFDNVAQQAKYGNMLEEVGLGRKHMLGMDFSNPHSRMVLQQRAAKLQSNPEYVKMKRDQEEMAYRVKDLRENMDKYGELAPQLAQQYNQYFENTDPDNMVDPTQFRTADYVPIDFDKNVTTLMENMEDEMWTEIQKSDDGSMSYVTQMTERTKERIGDNMRDYMLQSTPNVRNTLAAKGFIAKDQNGNFFITDAGQREIERTQNLFEKRQEEYKAKFATEKSGSDSSFQYGIWPNTNRSSVWRNNTASDRNLQKFDRSLIQIGADPGFTQEPVPGQLNNNVTYSFIENTFKEKDNDQDRYSAIFNEYPEMYQPGALYYVLTDNAEEFGIPSDQLKNLQDNKEEFLNANPTDLFDENGNLLVPTESGWEKAKTKSGNIASENIFNGGINRYQTAYNKAVSRGESPAPFNTRSFGPGLNPQPGEESSEGGGSTTAPGGGTSTQTQMEATPDSVSVNKSPIFDYSNNKNLNKSTENPQEAPNRQSGGGSSSGGGTRNTEEMKETQRTNLREEELGMDSISIRTNNPFNLSDRGYGQPEGGEDPIDGDARITRFPNVEQGIAAFYAKVTDHLRGRSRWASPDMPIKNWQETYATSEHAWTAFRDIANQMFGANIDPETGLRDAIEQVGGLDNFAQIMAIKENRPLFERLKDLGLFDRVTQDNYSDFL